jgi:3-keto-5-aminohexanoate cleavage enzyme
MIAPVSKLILMVAPTGSKYSKADHPSIPLSPREIAADVAACVKAGASVAHLHARDAQGRSTQDPAVYREIIERIREVTDVVIQISIGARGFAVEEAIKPLVLEPEMASLPLRNVMDEPGEVRTMASQMNKHGVVPSVDGSTLEMIQSAVELHRSGIFPDPLCVGFILGDPPSATDAEAKLRAFAGALPEGALWWALKGGAHMTAARTVALGMGGHIRTGLEDVAPPADGRQLTNVELVERVASLAGSLGRELASAADVRAMLGRLPA